jgi:hypothetical protein
MNANVHANVRETCSTRAGELETLAQLTQALDGQRSLEVAAATLLSPDLRGHMDEFVRNMGITPAGWIAWWEFLWAEGLASDVRCEHLETIEHGDSRYTLIGRWTGIRDGRRQRSEPIQAKGWSPRSRPRGPTTHSSCRRCAHD